MYHSAMTEELITTLTDRGQTSVPAALRKAGRLTPGLKLRWNRVSDREFRVAVVDDEPIAGPVAMRGFLLRGKRGRRRQTDIVLRELREGEAD